jgi:hypothetical protein
MNGMTVMQVLSVRNPNAPLPKAEVRSTQPSTSVSAAAPGGAKADKKVPTAAANRSDLPAWKAERNAARELHKSGSTEDWLAARTSWMATRDAFHAGRRAEIVVPAAPMVSPAQAEVSPVPIAVEDSSPATTQQSAA